MSSQKRFDRVSISIVLLVLLNVAVLLIPNINASSIRQSNVTNSNDTDHVAVPQSRTATTEDDDDKQRNFSIRLRDLQRLVGYMIDAGQMEIARGVDAQSLGMPIRRALHTALFNTEFVERIRSFFARLIYDGISTNTLQAGGRVFLFKGFKKLIWPVFIGIQVAKTVLLAMFLPSIIGSLGKMVGKGLVQVTGISQPNETIDDFEFKDNPPVDDPANGMGYNYPAHQSITGNHNSLDAHAMYDATPSAAATNPMSLYDLGEKYSNAQQFNLPDYAQSQTRKEMLQSKKDDFKVFHDIPASSLLLTNYDPFYSPLLSRLDAVFHQLHLNGENESCREKLVCLMYASPAKYMPYSNLVSAQLSRELNELRKPTSDNVEILRFFKYMRAARDGQNGQDCSRAYKKCSGFADTEQPAMLTTFNDINKLVQARKF